MALFGNEKTKTAAKAPVKRTSTKKAAPVQKTPVKRATAQKAPVKKAPVKKAAPVTRKPVAKKETGEKRVTKVEILRSMFTKVGKKQSVEDVMDATGYDLRNLRTTCGILRNENRTHEDNIMDLRFSDGIIQRLA